jgi:hypothetical protein
MRNRVTGGGLGNTAIGMGATSIEHASLQSTTVELGIVPPDSLIERSVSIPNNTSETLTISQVSPDCGCLVSKLASGSVPPGESLPLHFGYRSPSASGAIRRKIFIHFHQPDLQPMVIFIQGLVRSWADPEPRDIGFSECLRGVPQTRWLTITTCPAQELDLKDFRIAMPGLAIQTIEAGESVHPVDQQPQLSYRLHLAYTAPKDAEDFVRGEMELDGHGDQKRLVLPIHAQVTSVVSVHPSRAFFGLVKPDTRYDYKLMLRLHDPGRSFRGVVPKLAHNLGNDLTVQTSGEATESVLQLLCSYRTSATKGQRKGTISVEGLPGDTVKIPVDAWVE